MSEFRGETGKSYQHRLDTGFVDKYLSGIGIDVGPGNDPLPCATDRTNTSGDKLILDDNSLDYVYSSHMLEHGESPYAFIQEWHRVLKVGGYMVIIVPHAYLYERSLTKPSQWNADHKWFFTPANLLLFLETTLKPNTYRIRHLVDNDRLYNYELNPDTHPTGCYEIELVVEKINPPHWGIK